MSSQRATGSLRVILQVLVLVVLVPFLPLLLSRRWDWWQAWAFGIVAVLSFAISRALAARRHPDLLSERARGLAHADTKPWDKILGLLVGLGGSLIPLAAALEAMLAPTDRFGFPLELVALSVVVAGYSLAAAALIENRFFSGVVRIQTDRGHTVVRAGPYRWLRHPGYAGALAAFLATPFLLDSLWALALAGLIAITMVVRTHLEDRTLQEELPGYAEYSRSVRYRLLPGVW